MELSQLECSLILARDVNRIMKGANKHANRFRLLNGESDAQPALQRAISGNKDIIKAMKSGMRSGLPNLPQLIDCYDPGNMDVTWKGTLEPCVKEIFLALCDYQKIMKHELTSKCPVRHLFARPVIHGDRVIGFYSRGEYRQNFFQLRFPCTESRNDQSAPTKG